MKSCLQRVLRTIDHGQSRLIRSVTTTIPRDHPDQIDNDHGNLPRTSMEGSISGRIGVRTTPYPYSQVIMESNLAFQIRCYSMLYMCTSNSRSIPCDTDIRPGMRSHSRGSPMPPILLHLGHLMYRNHEFAPASYDACILRSADHRRYDALKVPSFFLGPRPIRHARPHIGPSASIIILHSVRTRARSLPSLSRLLSIFLLGTPVT